MNPSLPLPMDVKLMNWAATVLFAVFAAGLVAAGMASLLRLPAFSIAGISVLGDTGHNSVPTLRANVAPRIAGNIFTVNLQSARAVFESVPWVRQAVVRREFPNRLRVQLQEHRAVALWGAEGDSRLVNNFGEVFEANVDEAEGEDLPRLAGPDGQSAQVLAMYQSVKPLFEPLDLSVQAFTLTPRGSWEATLDNGAVIELGRGGTEEVRARAQKFAQTITQVAGRYGRRADAVQSADLRHSDGYAVRLRGVTTTADPAKN